MRCPTPCGRTSRCPSTCLSTSSTSSTRRRSWTERSPWWSREDLMCTGTQFKWTSNTSLWKHMGPCTIRAFASVHFVLQPTTFLLYPFKMSSRLAIRCWFGEAEVRVCVCLAHFWEHYVLLAVCRTFYCKCMQTCWETSQSCYVTAVESEPYTFFHSPHSRHHMLT